MNNEEEEQRLLKLRAERFQVANPVKRARVIDAPLSSLIHRTGEEEQEFSQKDIHARTDGRSEKERRAEEVELAINSALRSSRYGPSKQEQEEEQCFDYAARGRGGYRGSNFAYYRGGRGRGYYQHQPPYRGRGHFSATWGFPRGSTYAPPAPRGRRFGNMTWTAQDHANDATLNDSLPQTPPPM